MLGLAWTEATLCPLIECRSAISAFASINSELCLLPSGCKSHSAADIVIAHCVQHVHLAPVGFCKGMIVYAWAAVPKILLLAGHLPNESNIFRHPEFVQLLAVLMRKMLRLW